MKRLLFIFILGGIFSCNDNLKSDNLINELSEVEEANQMAGVLKFDSNDQIQEFLDELRDDKRVTNLTSDEVKKRWKMKKGITSLRSESVDAVPFISLLDSLKNRDLAHLTQADWDIINSDEENLVYEPEDYIIYDMYFSSVFK